MPKTQEGWFLAQNRQISAFFGHKNGDFQKNAGIARNFEKCNNFQKCRILYIYCLNQCLDILLYVVICYIFGQSSSYLIQAEVPLPKMAVPTPICLIKSTSNYLGISWENVSSWNYQGLFRSLTSNGEMWSSKRQIYGRLSLVS